VDLPASGGETAGIAYRAVAVDSGFAVLHPHPGGVLHLPLGFALEAVGLHHIPPYRQLLIHFVPAQHDNCIVLLGALITMPMNSLREWRFP
jgi:hypothetical protein